MTRLVLAAFLIILLGSISVIDPHIALAQAPAGPVAKAVSVQGTVEVRRAGQAQWQLVKLNDGFAPGDTIRVLARSRADLAMLDQSVLRLNANTEMTVEAPKDQRTGVVNLVRGATHFLSRGPRSLEVQTPFTVAGVRGTEFFIGVEPNEALVTVFEGTVVAQNPSGSLTLTSGQSAVAESGKAPVIRVVARPRDAVQWALYYPPVLYFRPDEFPAGAGAQGDVRRSVDAYRAGDLRGALDAIANVPATVSDPRVLAYRAHLLLAVGRVDEASADIARALQIAPNDTNALALQTIIAIVQGDKDRALDIAQKAAQADPKSATARIALSYAQQARFDLEGARANLQEAVKLDPQNALAWARLSELYASFAELNRARDAAEKAVALDPNLSRTQTVLGYAQLMRVNIKRAKEAFEKAIALDSADPLPRLGLGLAKIREGKLDAGSRELEAAASLDPNNSIVRSYLGKAYYEEKRTKLDQREYEIAKQLDPNDPTPWFYDAIAKQTTNRPVEAMHDLQRAIELNDNRAVYRSRLLLDEDLAARSASLGRIYNDLGFQQLGLVEGWKSVNTDPTNFSAHRFLADSYSVLPRHEIARVSELLQSQLLQPLNMTPIQPRLAESNLFLISAGGPGSLSFNEFNPIFNRNGVTLQATGLAGSHSTFAGEGIAAAIYNKASISTGYTHFSTDGFRKNADQTDDIANGFLQVELTPQASVQFEYRYRKFEHGDLTLRFFPSEVQEGFRTEEERHTFRVGGRYAFTPSSILLVSLMYQHSDSGDKLEPFPPPLSDTFAFTRNRAFQDATSAEVSHLFRSRYINLVTGAGYFDIRGRNRNDTGIDLSLFGLGVVDIDGSEPLNEKHVNAYAYSYISPLRNLTFTLGVSYDHLESDSNLIGDRNVWNPKFGVSWTPLSGTTVRLAAFKEFKRTLITDQTLEPTQVAGFNQFFDDINGTSGWRYGGAIDQKFTKDVFAGVEISRRDLSVPFQDFSDPANPTRREEDWKEQLYRAYLFWTPHRWLALRAEYSFERFTSEGKTTQPEELNTQRIPLGISFFHPSGFGATTTATYYHQDGKFLGLFEGVRSGNEDFWLLDVGVYYRLPKRYGIVSLGVTNLTDEKFRFFDRDLVNSSIQPSRTVLGKVTLALP